jgi:hypothetical protein
MTFYLQNHNVAIKEAEEPLCINLQLMNSYVPGDRSENTPWHFRQLFPPTGNEL